MKDAPKIIGLSGTNGAGKDSAGTLLADYYDYWFFSFTDLFRAECRRRGIEPKRENLRMISAEWRRESGYATLIDRSIQLYQQMGGDRRYKGIIMSSLRNPAEADRIHELGGIVLWVDADPKIRYERIQKSAAARGRASEDNKTYQEFLAEQEQEMHPEPGADGAALNMAAVKEKSDIFISNDTEGLEQLERDLAAALKLVRPTQQANTVS